MGWSSYDLSGVEKEAEIRSGSKCDLSAITARGYGKSQKVDTQHNKLCLLTFIYNQRKLPFIRPNDQNFDCLRPTMKPIDNLTFGSSKFIYAKDHTLYRFTGVMLGAHEKGLLITSRRPVIYKLFECSPNIPSGLSRL